MVVEGKQTWTPDLVGGDRVRAWTPDRVGYLSYPRMRVSMVAEGKQTWTPDLVGGDRVWG
jgi:hypothetical protein